MSRRPRGRGKRPGWVRALGWLAMLLASLSLVTWRQTQGLALERELRALEGRNAGIEAERVELTRRIEQLRSRSRVLQVARDRLGMHLPQDHEIIFLPVNAAPAAESVP